MRLRGSGVVRALGHGQLLLVRGLLLLPYAGVREGLGALGGLRGRGLLLDRGRGLLRGLRGGVGDGRFGRRSGLGHGRRLRVGTRGLGDRGFSDRGFGRLGPGSPGRCGFLRRGGLGGVGRLGLRAALRRVGR